MGSDGEDDFEPWKQYEYDEHTMEKRRKGALPNMKKFRRYPFLPSMLVGVGGPSTQWLPPKEHATPHPELFGTASNEKENSGITNIDLIMDKAQKRREEFE